MEQKVLEVNKDESSRVKVDEEKSVRVEKTSDFGPGKITCILVGIAVIFFIVANICGTIQDTVITREWIKGGMKPIPDKN